MGLIILGHIIGDFYVQTDEMAEKKTKHKKYMLLHGLIYGVVIYVLTYALGAGYVKSIIVALSVGILHIFIDSIKVKLELIKTEYECIIFVVDQIIHIITLLLICACASIKLDYSNYLFSEVIYGISIKKIIMLLISILTCWKPAAIFVALVFKIIPKINEKEELKEKKDDELHDNIKVGSWIGILEREVMLLLGIIGQYGAIGFVLTAKSLARFSQLNNQSFAERYLVGTLLSSFIAILCIVAYSIVK